MNTDFTYKDTTIAISGPVKVSGVNKPLNAKYRVEKYSDIYSIPNPAVGELVFVIDDVNYDHKQSLYVITELGPSSPYNIPNTAVKTVVPLGDFIGTQVFDNQLQALDDKKVDKVEGMGLSENNLTDELVAKINTISEDNVEFTEEMKLKINSIPERPAGKDWVENKIKNMLDVYIASGGNAGGGTTTGGNGVTAEGLLNILKDYIRIDDIDDPKLNLVYKADLGNYFTRDYITSVYATKSEVSGMDISGIPAILELKEAINTLNKLMGTSFTVDKGYEFTYFNNVFNALKELKETKADQNRLSSYALLETVENQARTIAELRTLIRDNDIEIGSLTTELTTSQNKITTLETNLNTANNTINSLRTEVETLKDNSAPRPETFIYYGRLSIDEISGGTKAVPFTLITENVIFNAANITKVAVSKLNAVDFGPEFSNPNDYNVVIIPADAGLKALKDDGTGHNLVEFDTDVRGANGLLLNIDGVKYKIYGEISLASDNLKFSIVNE